MNIHSNAKTCPASRALLVRRVREEGWTVEEAAVAAGVSERTGYKWLGRYRDEGKAGMKDRTSRPHYCPTKTAVATVMQIVLLRLLRLTIDDIARRVRPSRATVARIAKAAGLSRLGSVEPKAPPVRYERKRPGELLHIDIKHLGRIKTAGKRFGKRRGSVRAGWEYVHVAVDDHSRVAYVEVLPDKRAKTAIAFLQRAVDWFASQGVKVERVMTDNGSCYIAKTFKRACEKAGIKHIRIKPYRPCTNGKAERFIQTMCREWAYAREYKNSRARTAALRFWLRRYNHTRAHGSLGGKPPISRLEGAQ